MNSLNLLDSLIHHSSQYRVENSAIAIIGDFHFRWMNNPCRENHAENDVSPEGVRPCPKPAS